MAPLLVNVKNSSSEPRNLYMSDGKHFHITVGDQVTVNDHISDGTDTKIEINPNDDHKYLLKYDGVINILINDGLGRKKGVPDTPLWVQNEEERLYIEICEEKIKISGGDDSSVKDLKIPGSTELYHRVAGSHNLNGGITLTGDDPKEVQTKEGSSKSKD